MTKLEELIYSLTTVLIRYHDTQGVRKLVVETDPILLRKKSREYAISIIQKQDIKFDEQLKALIASCTKGYPDRLHFLTYVLHEITFLKEQLDRKNSFKPEELEEYQKQVAQLLKDFTQLLNTPKDKTHKVSYSTLNSESTTCIALSGLINNAYFGNEFCNSGLLLIEEVLNRFHMTRASTDEEIKEIALSICTENQHALLVSEFEHQKLEQELSKFKPDSLSLEVTDARNLELESRVSALETQVIELLTANQTQQKTIGELQTELDEAQKKLGSMQLELEIKQKELEETQSQQSKPLPYPFGLSALGMFRPARGFFFPPPQSPSLTQRSTDQDEDVVFGRAL